MSGDVVLRRQVSTQWPKLAEFRGQLHEALAAGEKYVAVVEVCGFHDWLVRWLQQDERCQQALVVQPLGRSAHKTDPRDANALSELLWVNRERLLRGDRVHGVRTVLLPSEEQQADRHLTQLRERLVLKRTQTLNQIHKILRRHNLEWERPTKHIQTRKVAEWLKTLPLGPMDRLTMDQLLVQWRLWEEQLAATDDSDRGAIPREPGRPTAGYDARREHVHRPGDRLPDRCPSSGFPMVGAWQTSLA